MMMMMVMRVTNGRTSIKIWSGRGGNRDSTQYPFWLELVAIECFIRILPHFLEIS